MIHDHKFYGAIESVPNVNGVSELVFFSNDKDSFGRAVEWNSELSGDLVSQTPDANYLRVVSAHDGRFVVIARHSVGSFAEAITGSKSGYPQLFSALTTLRNLDEDESMAIDEHTYNSARNALSFLSYKNVEPPRIFAHGGDAVVFNWSRESVSFQLTISSGIAALGKRTKGEGVAILGYVDMSERGIGELISHLQVDSGWAGTNKSTFG